MLACSVSYTWWGLVSVFPLFIFPVQFALQNMLQLTANLSMYFNFFFHFKKVDERNG